MGTHIIEAELFMKGGEWIGNAENVSLRFLDLFRGPNIEFKGSLELKKPYSFIFGGVISQRLWLIRWDRYPYDYMCVPEPPE